MNLTNSALSPVVTILDADEKLRNELSTQFPCWGGSARPSSELSATQIFQILLFLKKSGKESIAFMVGLNLPMGSLASLDYFLASCSSLGKALLALIKYHPLLATQTIAPLIKQKNSSEISVTFNAPAFDNEEQQLKTELVVAVYIKIINRLSQTDSWPNSMMMAKKLANKQSIEYLNSLLDLKVGIGEHYSFSYDKTALNNPLPFANGSLIKLLGEELDHQLMSLNQSITIITKVNNTIKLEKSFSDISLKGVAESLFMSESSLKRALVSEGTSFSKIINSHKKELSMSLVLNTQYSNDHIASQLGYTDKSSFERAFKGWFKFTPAQLKSMTGLMKIDAEKIKESDIFALPTSSLTCQRILQTMQKENYSIAELAEVISHDPIVTGKLIGIAGSAFYGGRTVANIEDAIVKVLGVEMIQNLTLSIMASRELQTEQCQSFDATNNWLLPLVTAELIKLFLNEPKIRADDDSPYLVLAALLHNIGTFAMVYLRPVDSELFIELMNNTRTDWKVTTQLQLQKKVFSISVFKVASLFLTHWGLPTNVCDLVQALEKAFNEKSKEKNSVLLLAYLSGYVRNLLRNSNDPKPMQQWVVKLAHLLEISTEQVEEKLLKVTKNIDGFRVVAKELTKA